MSRIAHKITIENDDYGFWTRQELTKDGVESCQIRISNWMNRIFTYANEFPQKEGKPKFKLPVSCLNPYVWIRNSVH